MQLINAHSQEDIEAELQDLERRAMRQFLAGEPPAPVVTHKPRYGMWSVKYTNDRGEKCLMVYDPDEEGPRRW